MPVTSVVLGVVGLLCGPIVFPALGVLTGALALGEINSRTAPESGRAMARMGIWLGGVTFVLQSILGIAILVALVRTPPVEVFYENNLPTKANAFLRDNHHVDQAERILLYYDDSILSPFKDVSLLTNQHVMSVVGGTATRIPLRRVTGVRYTEGDFFTDFVIEVASSDGTYLKLVFTMGADVEGFAKRITEEVRRAGGRKLDVEYVRAASDP